MPKLSDGAGLARSVCLAQLAIAGIVALTIALIWNRAQAAAALYGGAAACVPTLYFALRVFWRRAGETPNEVVGAIFRGEIGKFALTAVMFAIGVKVFAAQFPALLAAYTACLLAYWIVMARVGFGGSGTTG
jgi:ATP synthase protein I